MERRVHIRWLYLGLSIAFTIVYVVNLFAQAGSRVAGIVGGSMLGGMVCWLLTTWRRPAAPERILPLYLVTLGLFFVHILEEYLFNFAGRIAALFHMTWPEHDFVLTIMFGGPMIWLGAAVGPYYRNPFGNFIAWFILFGMIIGEPVHFVFALLEGGRYHYFPGAATALLPMVTALYAMKLIVGEHRAALRDPRGGP